MRRPKSNEMTYYDFIIQKKHKFLRNIYEYETLNESECLKCLKDFLQKFSRIYEYFNTSL